MEDAAIQKGLKMTETKVFTIGDSKKLQIAGVCGLSLPETRILDSVFVEKAIKMADSRINMNKNFYHDSKNRSLHQLANTKWQKVVDFSNSGWGFM